MRAMTSPTDTRAPSSRLISAPGGSVYTAGISVFAKVHFLALGVQQLDGRTQVLAAALLGIEHHGRGQAGHFVHLRRDREAVDEVLELDVAAPLR